jgi:hypothetical protein
VPELFTTKFSSRILSGAKTGGWVEIFSSEILLEFGSQNTTVRFAGRRYATGQCLPLLNAQTQAESCCKRGQYACF